MHRRDHALDALRGLAFIMMAVSWLMPSVMLPSWAYPAQLPPPEHIFDQNRSGIHWSDLVLPFYVFCLGASLSYALNKRLPIQGMDRESRRKALGQTVGYVIGRTLDLAALAILFGSLRGTNFWEQRGWRDSLLWLAFGVMATVRLPALFTPPSTLAIKILGWAGLLWGLIQYRFDVGFTDPNLAAAALVWLGASLVTILAWRHDKARALVGVGLMVVLSLAPTRTLLFPNMDAGNAFGIESLRWIGLALLASSIPTPDTSSSSTQRLGFLSLSGIALTLVSLVALAYDPQAGLWILLVAALSVWWFFRDEGRIFLRWMVGTTSLVLGLALSQFDGGARRTPGSVSFLFLGFGAALFAYLSFVFLDRFWNRAERVQVSDQAYLRYGKEVRGLSLLGSTRSGFLAALGENSLLAYLALFNFLFPLLHITGASTFLEQGFVTPPEKVVSALIQTLALGLVVSACSRFRIYARA